MTVAELRSVLKFGHDGSGRNHGIAKVVLKITDKPTGTHFYAEWKDVEIEKDDVVSLQGTAIEK